MDKGAPGEFELIARLTQNLHSHEHTVLGVGDDCAILDLGADAWLLMTCDSQVESVHFTLQTSSPLQIGHKALAVNLSDIAAMGGQPRYALVSLILPSQFPIETLDGIYVGLHEEAERYGTTIVGGNIASAGNSKQLVIDITLLGTVRRGQALTRGGAHVGDTLCVTGSLGDSAAGLQTLLHPDSLYPQEALAVVQARHRIPQPRIREGQILSRFGPDVVTAMLDISDGLSGDLGHLCERSRVGARVDLARLPLSPAIYSVAAIAGRDPLHWAMHGGEDYELLFTISPGHEQAVIDAVQTVTGTVITTIGTLLPAEEGLQQLFPDGHRDPLVVQSWDHFR
jgi:thiamine-monophosphate kinase